MLVEPMDNAGHVALLPQNVARLDKLRIAQKTKQDQLKVPPPTAQLPLWPEPTRGTPNAWLRGALFAAIQGKERRALKRELLVTVDGLEIRFTGWQLDQSDLDVWDAIVHLSRLRPIGEQVEFTAHSILRALGRDTGKSQHEWLKDAVARLYSAGVEITAGRFTYFGALLKGARDEATGHYQVQLARELLDMYLAGWTQIKWEERTALRRKPLALWLHGWFSTHAQPYPIRVETLRRLSGSRNKDVSGFKRLLRAALIELETISAITKWEVRGDVVHITRCPTPSQRKHLAKARKQRV